MKNDKMEEMYDDFVNKNFKKDIIIPHNIKTEINNRIGRFNNRRLVKLEVLVSCVTIAVVIILLSISYIKFYTPKNVDDNSVAINKQIANNTSTTPSDKNMYSTEKPISTNSRTSEPKPTDNKTNKLQTNKPISNDKMNSNIDIAASWAKEYKNVEDLYINSDDVVIADVVGLSQNIKSGSSNFVTTIIKVTQSFKGLVNNGRNITIQETGSFIDGSNEASIDGVPLLKQNMKVVLFLKEIDNNKWIILNDYMGKFILNDNGTVTYSGNLSKFDHVNINGFNDGISINDFILKINQLK